MNAIAYKIDYDIIHPIRKNVAWKVIPTTANHTWNYKSKPDYIEQFDSLVTRWRQESMAMSTIKEMTALTSFKEIVAIGKKALPLVYRHLRDQPSMLVVAGIEISGENPTPEQARGDIKKIVAAWLRWAERTGAVTD